MLFSSNNKEPTEFEAKEENIELIEKLKSLKLLVEDLHIKLFTKRKLKPGYTLRRQRCLLKLKKSHTKRLHAFLHMQVL